MSRPTTQDEYLASLVPASVRGVDRRTLLRGALGAGTLLAAPDPAVRAAAATRAPACRPESATGTVTLGSNQSDAVPKAAVQAVHGRLRRRPTPGMTVKINTVDHNTFQENINNYLQGTPGRRLHLVRRLPDAVLRRARASPATSPTSGRTSAGCRDALKKASTGDDGKQYFVPSQLPVGGLLPQERLRRRRATRSPKTLDELKTLGAQMKKDGLVPIAFGDKDGWPAMGTFDQLNMRVNGYDFHVSLMAGKEAWNDAKVKKVFDTWAGHAALHQAGSLGRTWQEAAQSLQQKKSGMYLLGTFVAQQFAKGAEQDDLDFFAFPEVDSTIGTDAVEAPIDGFMMSAKPEERGRRQEAARVPRLGRGAEPRRQGRPERHRDEQRRPTPAATPPCRRSRPSSSVAPRPSRSSWTATPAPTSPRR